MQVFWIVFSHFSYIFCAHCILYSKNLYFPQYTSNYLFVFYIITFSIFSGGLPEQSGFRESRRSALSSHCRKCNCSHTEQLQRKTGWRDSDASTTSSPCFLFVIYYTRNSSNCVIFLTFLKFYTQQWILFSRQPEQCRRPPHTPWRHRPCR